MAVGRARRFGERRGRGNVVVEAIRDDEKRPEGRAVQGLAGKRPATIHGIPGEVLILPGEFAAEARERMGFYRERLRPDHPLEDWYFARYCVEASGSTRRSTPSPPRRSSRRPAPPRPGTTTAASPSSGWPPTCQTARARPALAAGDEAGGRLDARSLAAPGAEGRPAREDRAGGGRGGASTCSASPGPTAPRRWPTASASSPRRRRTTAPGRSRPGRRARRVVRRARGAGGLGVAGGRADGRPPAADRHVPGRPRRPVPHPGRGRARPRRPRAPGPDPPRGPALPVPGELPPRAPPPPAPRPPRRSLRRLPGPPRPRPPGPLDPRRRSRPQRPPPLGSAVAGRALDGRGPGRSPRPRVSGRPDGDGPGLDGPGHVDGPDGAADVAPRGLGPALPRIAGDDPPASTPPAPRSAARTTRPRPATPTAAPDRAGRSLADNASKKRSQRATRKNEANGLFQGPSLGPKSFSSNKIGSRARA